MTTYCIDENKNLVNTLAITKREFTFNIQITSPVQETDTWGFQLEYNEEFVLFINAHITDILAVNLSGTILDDKETTMYPAFIVCTSTHANIKANILINGYDGKIVFVMNEIITLLNLYLETPTTTTPDWVQGNTYTLVVTVYVAS